jgi:hypothetical protein
MSRHRAESFFVPVLCPVTTIAFRVEMPLAGTGVREAVAHRADDRRLTVLLTRPKERHHGDG